MQSEATLVRPIVTTSLQRLEQIDVEELLKWINSREAFHDHARHVKFTAKKDDVTLAIKDIQVRLKSLRDGTISLDEVSSITERIPNFGNHSITMYEHLIIAISTFVSHSAMFGANVLYCVSNRNFDTIYKKIANLYMD